MQEEFTAAHLLLAKLQLAQQNKSAAIQTLEKLLKYAPNHQKAIALLDSLKSR